MAYVWTILGWIRDETSEEAVEANCGRSVYETVNAETMDDAKYFILQRYPTLTIQQIICPALDINTCLR